MRTTISNRLSFREQLSYALSRARGVRIETDLGPYLAILEEIQGLDFSKQEDSELQALGRSPRRRAADGEPLDSLLPVSFALIAKVSSRTIGLAPFDEQILAGIVLHPGKLAEMQTGEGKTLAAVFPAVLNALLGKGVHIMTANDYLDRRDADWMGPIYRFLGLRVDYVQEKMSVNPRERAYGADVTYLIDEERIPLVIAGHAPQPDVDPRWPTK